MRCLGAGLAMAAALAAAGCGEDKSGPPSQQAAEKAIKAALRSDCEQSYELQIQGADAAATPDASGAHALTGVIALRAKGTAEEARACLDRIQRSPSLGHQGLLEIVVDDFRRREMKFQELEQERLRRLAAPPQQFPGGGVDMTDHSRPTNPIEPETLPYRVEGSLRRWSSGWKAENVQVRLMPGYQTYY